MLRSAEFWVAVSFALFAALILWQKVPSMLTAELDKRAAAIKNQLDEAKRLREEAQKVLSDYKRKHLEAEQEAGRILDQAKREAQALTDETRRGLQETLERRTKLAEDKIARAEAQATAEVRARAVDAALSAAETLIKSKLSGPTSQNLIDQSIGDLGKRLN